jgi:hypothetical protein
MPFKPGPEKIGSRRGSVNKSILARQRAIVEAMQTVGLAPEVLRHARAPNL